MIIKDRSLFKRQTIYICKTLFSRRVRFKSVGPTHIYTGASLICETSRISYIAKVSGRLSIVRLVLSISYISVWPTQTQLIYATYLSSKHMCSI